MTRFELVRLPGRPPGWDELIAKYDTKTLFHESCWLDHILSIHPSGRIEYFEIRDGGNLIGYHCAYVIRKFGLAIHGSPLGGTGTNFMGPIVEEETPQDEVLEALVRLLGLTGSAHMELSHPWLERANMEAHGFSVHQDVTHMLKLEATEEEAWDALKGTARNRVRKALKQGVVVERATTEDVVDHYVEQHREVFGKQGMVPPYGRDRVASLFRTLLPAGRLLALWVKQGDTVLATGLFPHDERCIYFWGGASWLEYQSLCPNELLHWEAIRSAVEMGIPAYNMCGGRSRFKDKFGGEDVPYLTYSRSALPGLQVARQIYRWWHFQRLKN